MAKKKISPVACPHCGAEREWRALPQPETPRPSVGKALLVGLSQALFGLLGRLLTERAIDSPELVTYRCSKCGHEEQFRPD